MEIYTLTLSLFLPAASILKSIVTGELLVQLEKKRHYRQTVIIAEL